MGQILLGALAFALAFAFDWASWRRIPVLKPALGLAVVLTFGAALAWTLAIPGRYGWPGWLAVLGWVPMLAGAALLVHSLFLEIPFTPTYARRGTGEVLVTTGTYALVRHPGVLWFGLWAFGCILASRSRLMLRAGVVWFAMDVVYVWLQEVVLFDRMLPGYPAYRERTPMLVPTSESVARCLRTLRLRLPRSA